MRTASSLAGGCNFEIFSLSPPLPPQFLKSLKIWGGCELKQDKENNNLMLSSTILVLYF